MPGKLRSRRPSHATVVAYLALFVALGGTSAFAAHETIFTDDIVDGEVKNPDLGADAVSTTKIQSQGVTNADLAPNTITATRLAPESVETSEIKQGSVFNADLAGNSITSSRLADNSVGTSEVQNGAVTLSKLAPWNASLILAGSGPLPSEANFNSSGGQVLIMASGSAFRNTNTPGRMEVAVIVDGNLITRLEATTDELNSHKTLVSKAVPHATLPPGLHTIRLEAISSGDCGGVLDEDPDDVCTATDAKDNFSLTVIELPD